MVLYINRRYNVINNSYNEKEINKFIGGNIYLYKKSSNISRLY